MPCPPSGDLPNPGIEPRSPTLQADSLPSEPPGKTKNTGVGNLSLLQGLFLTRESNWGLLHCREILYQLGYQGSPTSNGIWGQNKYLGCHQRMKKVHCSEERSLPLFLASLYLFGKKKFQVSWSNTTLISCAKFKVTFTLPNISF